jgi:hypothetical protein
MLEANSDYNNMAPSDDQHREWEWWFFKFKYKVSKDSVLFLHIRIKNIRESTHGKLWRILEDPQLFQKEWE